MSRNEGFEAYATFRHLGGRRVHAEEITREIARWPLDGFLGFLGAISLEMFQTETTFLDPRWQGNYLNRAIADDFPEPLPRASSIYSVGSVPLTGGVHILVHEHNCAWLAHAALLYADRVTAAPDLSQGFVSRICRLLLLINDQLPAEPRVRGLTDRSPLQQRRQCAIDWLRHYQFNRYVGGGNEAFIRLARQRIILLTHLPRYYPEVESLFLEATNGVSLQRYLEILCLFIAHLAEGLNPGRRWLRKDTMCSELKDHRDEVERLLFGRWARTPEAYVIRVDGWNRERPPEGYLPYYDYVPLRETPLVEARPGELVCPVVPLLLAKVEDDPYYILTDHLSGNRGEQDRLHEAFGRAYEQYASSLVSRLSDTDRVGKWKWIPSPRSPAGGELTDDLLVRGSVAICWEHKGGRPATDFLRGGPGDRVIGPPEDVLECIDGGVAVTSREGRERDEGYLTKGVWQLNAAGAELLRFCERKGHGTMEMLFPIITHLAGLPVDPMVYTVYMDPLLAKAGLLGPPTWKSPQWIHITDLETLVALAEREEIDLESVLRMKGGPAERRKRFDLFLGEQGASSGPPTFLQEAATELLRESHATFWPGEPWRVENETPNEERRS